MRRADRENSTSKLDHDAKWVANTYVELPESEANICTSYTNQPCPSPSLPPSILPLTHLTNIPRWIMWAVPFSFLVHGMEARYGYAATLTQGYVPDIEQPRGRLHTSQTWQLWGYTEECTNCSACRERRGDYKWVWLSTVKSDNGQRTKWRTL